MPVTAFILEVNSAIRTATPSSVAANIALLATCSTCGVEQVMYGALYVAAFLPSCPFHS